ncbi:MAG: AAA family ATPase [Clostridia bacterium]|nr:AAA family ATPase [Clostridia bacterium]
MRTSTGSERAFLGAVIRGEARASDHDLLADDFTDVVCRRIFAACVRIEMRSEIVDLVTACDALPDDTEALIELSAEAAGSGALAAQYGAHIRDAAQRRQVEAVFLHAAQAAKARDAPLEEIISQARTQLDQISRRTASSDSISGTDAMVELLLHLDGEAQETPVPLGLPKLDEQFGGGLRGGKLVVIGARPAVGKSALLSFCAVNALKAGRRVLYISLEMSEREVIGRMTAQITGVSTGKIEHRTLSDGDYLCITERVPAILGENLRISTVARTPAAIRRLALQMKAAGGLDLVCVDYLQLLYPDQKTSGRVEAVGEISRALKLLALELGCPVIAAAQVNRASAQGEDRPPHLSELRESGSIEQDADVVLMLHSPLKENPNGERFVSLYVAKHRQGRMCRLDLRFDGALMRYRQVS